jgi:hypothetical protein
MPTEPTQLSGNRNRSHSHQYSFNAHTGEKESIQFLWENSAWGRLERSKGKVMERANTFVGPAPVYHRKERKELDEAIAVVDPFSTGAHLAKQVALAGYKVVRILSIWDSPVAALVEKGLVVEYCATLQFNDLNPNPEAAMAEVTDSAVRLCLSQFLSLCLSLSISISLFPMVSVRLFPKSKRCPSLSMRSSLVLKLVWNWPTLCPIAWD